MLNRRKQIQKYTKAIRNKNTSQQLKNHLLLKHALHQRRQQDGSQDNEGQQNKIEVQYGEQQHIKSEQDIEEDEEACWNDSDGEDFMVNTNGNKIKKLTKTMNNPKQLSISKYEKKLGKFYSSRYGNLNWAQNTQNNQTVQEKDVADYLNQQVYYADTNKIKSVRQKMVKFSAKTPQQHKSIVTGMCWQKDILFTCGYDKKLLIYHYNIDKHINEQKMKLQKQIYIKDFPLSQCYYNNGQVIMGSLHKNMIIIDTNKWEPKFITSNFLKDIKSYQNLRVTDSSTKNRQCGLFSNKTICLLDKNNLYTGSLFSNLEITDFTFSSSDPNYCYSTTHDTIYQWDLRKMQVSGMLKQYLNFTSLHETKNGNLVVGSKLGGLYIYSVKESFRNQHKVQPIENNNLLTDITKISSNLSGDTIIALSKWKSNAARVITTDDGKALKDWPAPNTKFGIGQQTCWGYNSSQEWFSIGNSNGQTLTYSVVPQI